MRRYALARRYRCTCTCCQWNDDSRGAVRAEERRLIQRELQEYFESLEGENCESTIP